MPKSFTHYWAEDENADLHGMPLQHVASENFRNRGVEVGDTIFVVNQHDEKLFLIGYMTVEQIGNRESAEQFLGVPVTFGERADHCVCTIENGSSIIFGDELPNELFKELQFIRQDGSITGISLTPDGGVQQQTMRTVRRLTEHSADLLLAYIESEAAEEEEEEDDEPLDVGA